MKLRTLIFIINTIIKTGRICKLINQTKNIAKTVGIGLAAGTAVVAIGSQIAKKHNRPSRNMRKAASKAVHTVGSAVTNLEKILK